LHSIANKIQRDRDAKTKSVTTIPGLPLLELCIMLFRLSCS